MSPSNEILENGEECPQCGSFNTHKNANGELVCKDCGFIDVQAVPV